MHVAARSWNEDEVVNIGVGPHAGGGGGDKDALALEGTTSNEELLTVAGLGIYTFSSWQESTTTSTCVNILHPIATVR